MNKKFPLEKIPTMYGQEGEPTAPPRIQSENKNLMNETHIGKLGGEMLPINEYYRREAEGEEARRVREGEELDKAKARVQAVDTDPIKANLTSAEFRELEELEGDVSVARTEVERNPVADRNDPEERKYFQGLVEEVAKAEKRLADFRSKHGGAGNVDSSAESEDDAGATMKIKRQGPGIIERIKGFFGKK
jgi:hypothetical protein